MKTLSLAMILLALSTQVLAENIPADVQKRCMKENPQEEHLWATDFKYGYSLPELIQRFTEIYPDASKRLQLRAYYDSAKQALMLPQDSYNGGDVELPLNFVVSIQKHIETAYQMKYINAVFFPDMGHSHYLIPNSKWKKIYLPMPNEERAKMYNMMFQDPDIKVLYHTAEQLKTLNPDNTPINDPQLQWRWKTRNIVGDNQQKGQLQVLQNPESAANTVSGVPGYYWWGGGFNLSANQSGCFAFVVNGKTMYFDLSLSDLQYKPGTGDDLR